MFLAHNGWPDHHIYDDFCMSSEHIGHKSKQVLCNWLALTNLVQL